MSPPLALRHLHFRFPPPLQLSRLFTSPNSFNTYSSGALTGRSWSSPATGSIRRYCIPAIGGGAGLGARSTGATSTLPRRRMASSDSDESASSSRSSSSVRLIDKEAGIGRWTGRAVFVSPSPGPVARSSSGTADSPISITSSPRSSESSRTPSPEPSRQPSTPLTRPRAVAHYSSPHARTAYTPPQPFYPPSPARQASYPAPARVHPFFNRTFARTKSAPVPHTPPPPASQRPRMVADYSSTSESQASTATGADSTFGSQPSQPRIQVPQGSPSRGPVGGKGKARAALTELEIDKILSQVESIDLSGKLGPTAKAAGSKGKVAAPVSARSSAEASGLVRSSSDVETTKAGSASGSSGGGKSALGRYGRVPKTNTASSAASPPKTTAAVEAPAAVSAVSAPIQSRSTAEIYPLPPKAGPTSNMSATKSTTTLSSTIPTSEASGPPVPLAYYKYTDHKPCPEVVYTTSISEADQLLGRLEGQVMGLDLEWPMRWWDKEASRWQFRPGKTALIQVCDERLIVLLHLKDGNNMVLPKKLVSIMENPAIYKCGVQVRGDGKRLVDDFPGSFPTGVKSLLELSNVARAADPIRCGPGLRLISLANLVKNYLGRELEKDPQVRQSNWSSSLNQKQVDYGANDVFAGLQVYLHLKRLAAERQFPIDLDRCSNSFNADGSPDYRAISTRTPSPSIPTFTAVPGSTDLFAESFAYRLAPGQPKFPPPAHTNALNAFKSGMTIEAITAERGVKRSTIEGYICQALAVLEEETLSAEEKGRLVPQLKEEYVRRKFRGLIVSLRRGAEEDGVSSTSESEDERGVEKGRKAEPVDALAESMAGVALGGKVATSSMTIVSSGRMPVITVTAEDLEAAAMMPPLTESDEEEIAGL